MRCLNRRLSDIVFRTMVNDAVRQMTTSPGGLRGDESDSSAAGSHPQTGTPDKLLTGPATAQPRTDLPAAS
jgi:hypothetical protein